MGLWSGWPIRGEVTEMGMFDTLRCAWPLPDGFEQMQDNVFQTKSLLREMREFRIGADGILYEKEADGLHTLVAFHGDIEFYDFDESPEANLVRFRARFTHSMIEEIVCLGIRGRRTPFRG